MKTQSQLLNIKRQIALILMYYVKGLPDGYKWTSLDHKFCLYFPTFASTYSSHTCSGLE